MSTLVIDCRMINSSGIGTYLKNIVPKIISNFEEVVLLGNRKELNQFEWTKNIKVVEFTAKIYSVKEQLLYPFVIPRCDIFWSPHFNVPLFSIRAKKRVCTIHDVNHLANKNMFPKLIRIIAKLLYKRAVISSDIIFTISEFSKSEIIKYLGSPKKSKINVIYNGVDIDRFSNLSEIQTKISLPKKYILFVGNVKPHKNLITLLKSYNELPIEIKKEYKLVILGKRDGFITKDKWVYKYIENHNLIDHIYFTGYVEDHQIPTVYRSSSLFVFPSLYEGFGLPMLEAMATGVPVLSSNVSSLPEIGGNAAMYFEPFNYTDLCSKIKLLLANDKERIFLSQKGHHRIIQFNWESSVQNYINIISKC